MTTPAPFGRLHIVPIIALPRGLEAGQVRLRVSYDPAPRGRPMPEPVLRAFGKTDVIVVAGTEQRRNGWVMALQNQREVSDGTIVFEWTCGDVSMIHIVRFDLTDLGRADDPFWSMDSSYWSLAGYSETRNMRLRDRRRIMAVAAFDETEVPRDHQRTFTTRWQAGSFIIEERLTLHAIEYETAVRAARKWSRSKEHLGSEAPCGAL